MTVSFAPLFDSLQILKLSDLFKLQVTSFVYECLNSFAPIYFREYFTSIQSIHSIGTRQSRKGDLYALRCNTTQYGLRSIHYSGVRIWNSLPVEIGNSQSLPNFKKKMKAYFLFLIPHFIYLKNFRMNHIVLFSHFLDSCYCHFVDFDLLIC